MSGPLSGTSTGPSLTWIDHVKHFIVDSNESPEYGLQDRWITGLGFLLLQPASFAYSCFEQGCNAPTLMEKIAHIATAIAIAILTSPVTIIGAALKMIGSQFLKKVGPLTSDMIPKTSPVKIDQIYDLLEIINTVLRRENIDYSMDGGSLLGAVRSRGIIPWDDDGDIIIHRRHEGAVLALRDELQAYNIILENSGMQSLKLTFNGAGLQERYGITRQDAAHVDIFFVEEAEEGRTIRPSSDFFKNQFPREYFLPEELQNLEDYPFGPPERQLYLRGPANPRRYLSTYYGEDFMQYAVRSHSHMQLGSFSFPLLNLTRTKYELVPGYAEGINWRSSVSKTDS